MAEEVSFRTFEDLFEDFKGIRAALIKALTTDADIFDQECDPEKEDICLFGFPNERWEVNLPAEMLPPDLPEPALGINSCRDNLERKEWLALVAAHSDAWLVAVAFFGSHRADYRKRLFDMINDLPTVTEVVRGANQKQSKDSSNSKDSTDSDPLQH